MLNIHFVTRVRGFFSHLLHNNDIIANITVPSNKVYEVNNKLIKVKNKIGRSWIFDLIGYIQILKCNDTYADIYASSNRFLHTKKPYFIYIENPTGLFHYQLKRVNNFFGRRTIQRELNSKKLCGLVFMSRACESTFETVCYRVPTHIHTAQIYPLVPLNRSINNTLIEEKCKQEELKLLFVSQGTFFRVKGGIEVLEAFDFLRKRGFNISLEIITKIHDLEPEIKSRILMTEGIILNDFNYSYPQLEVEYFKNHVLLSPTSMDSFSLTVLEAMKSGMVVIASRLYAIPEMVKEGINGYLCDPQFWFFDRNNIPNPKVWNHRKETVFSSQISSEIISFLCDKISLLYKDRILLTEMSIKSYSIASQPPFSEEYITKQWNDFFTIISTNIDDK